MEDRLAYRNIQYANAERFAPAELVPFQGPAVEQGRGPVPPQNRSRFDVLLGPQAPLEQAEDCQVLSVFTPGSANTHPVMIWFHGGACITGGGELPWYDGSHLSVEQDVVVVSVTARLGALGYLVLNDIHQPSPATTDQLTAIEWVNRYIDQFGGDPDNITLVGQSAGGFAIEVMLRWGIGSHVKGAIIQSGFIKQEGLVYKHEDVVKQAESFKSLLGCDPRSVSVTELLAAQERFASQAGAAEIWAPVRPEDERNISIPLISGLTRHDTLPFILFENGIGQPSPEHFDTFADETERRNCADVLRGAQETLDDALAHGQKCWLYEFGWEIPESGWGAPHCIELPFLFGGRNAWAATPILRGADWDTIERKGQHLRAVWASFARSRDPGADWVGYDTSARISNRFQNQPST